MSAIEHRTTAAGESTTGLVPHSPFRITRFDKGSDKLSHRSRVSVRKTMIDGKSIQNKLIGSDDERAVSPVIGVILMVAITVILAAVIAAFVLDMGQGQEEPVNAAVNVEVSNADNTTTITITDAGNAESFELRGEAVDGAGDLDISKTGESKKYTGTGNFKAGEEGTVVGIKGDSETVVATFEIGSSWS